MGMIGGVLLVQ